MKNLNLTILFLFLVVKLTAQPCNVPLPPGATCQNAPLICNINNYCSTLLNSNPTQAPAPFCGILENAHWLSFVAGSGALSLLITPSNCQLGDGMQGHILFTTNCQDFISVSNCWNVVGATSFQLFATNLVAGQVYYILLDGKGGDVCTYKITVQNGFTQTPEMADAEPSHWLCAGDTLILDGSGSVSGSHVVYQWTTGDGTIVSGANTLSPAVSSAGTYYLVVNDTIAVCSDTASVVVMDAPPLDVVIDVPDTLNCLTNKSVLLKAAIFSQNPVYTEWRDLDDQIFEVNKDTFRVQSPGSYIFQIVDLVTGCMADDTVEVHIDIASPKAEAGPGGELNCLKAQIQLDGTGSSSGVPFISEWTTLTGNILSGVNTQTPVVNAPGWYKLEVRNQQNGCIATDSVLISLNDKKPSGATIKITPPCFGETFGEVRIDSVFGGNPPFTYSLDGLNFIQNPLFKGVPSGSYTLLIKDAAGCTWDTTVTISPLPEITLNLGTEVEIRLGDSLQLNALLNLFPNQLAEIMWLPDSTLSCSDCLTPYAKPLLTTTYQLTVTDKNGCTAEAFKLVRVDKTPRIYVPNAFSPNGDGLNDVAAIFGGSGVAVVKTFQIFNRWGGQVYVQNDFLPNDPATGWDGTVKGKPATPGVFTWMAVVQFVDGKEGVFGGSLHLLR